MCTQARHTLIAIPSLSLNPQPSALSPQPSALNPQPPIPALCTHDPAPQPNDPTLICIYIRLSDSIPHTLRHPHTCYASSSQPLQPLHGLRHHLRHHLTPTTLPHSSFRPGRPEPIYHQARAPASCRRELVVKTRFSGSRNGWVAVLWPT